MLYRGGAFILTATVCEWHVLEKILLKCTGKEVTIDKYGMQLELREGLNTGSKSAE